MGVQFFAANGVSIKVLAKSKGMEYNKAKAIIDSRIHDLIHEKKMIMAITLCKTFLYTHKMVTRITKLQKLLQSVLLLRRKIKRLQLS